MRSSVTQEELGVESLLLCMEKSQLRYLFGKLLDASVERCSGHVPSGGGPEEDSRYTGGTLAWERLGVPVDELEEGLWAGKSGCLC